MDRIRIVGGQRLNGTIPISGAKNAALPLMIASLLTRETLTLNNVPRLADVQSACPHSRQSRRRRDHRRQEVGPAHQRRPDLQAHRARDRRHHRALRDGGAHARELLGARAARRALRQGQGLAARRLRHRHAPRRSASDHARGARRRDRARRRLRDRQGAARAHRQRDHALQGLGRRDP